MPTKRTETKVKAPAKAKAALKPTVRRRRKAATEGDIALRAYFLHLDGGHDPVENWLQAERELAAR
jgi:hypothetical protein